MKLNTFAMIGGLVITVAQTSCGFVAQQLSDKAQEERLLKPGALDTGIATNFNEYHFRFLDRYRVRHQWPVTSACHYAQYSTKYRRGEINYGEVEIVDDIYEDGPSVWQRGDPRQGFNNYVKSVIRHQPIYGPKGLERYEDQEQGLQPVCFQAWTGTSQTLTLRLVKLPLEERLAHYATRPSRQKQEVVGSQAWRVWKYELEKDNPNVYGGEVWLTTIADTGYTLALELGEGPELDRYPQARADMRALFHHLIESVKIEPLTPTIEAELAQLKVKAEEIVRQDCIEMAKRTKPGAWCQKYLSP